MKDAFQKEHEGEDENDWMIGPKGTKVMTPEALQRKSVRDRAVSEEVRQFHRFHFRVTTRYFGSKSREGVAD
jgi:hypothetical protein